MQSKEESINSKKMSLSRFAYSPQFQKRDDRAGGQASSPEINYLQAKEDFVKRKYRVSYRVLSECRKSIGPKPIVFKIKYLRLYTQAFLKVTKIGLIKRQNFEMHTYEEQTYECLESLAECERLIMRYSDAKRNRLLHNIHKYKKKQCFGDEYPVQSLNQLFQINSVYCSILECLVYGGMVYKRNDNSAQAIKLFESAINFSKMLVGFTNNPKLVSRCILSHAHLGVALIETGKIEESIALFNQGLDYSLIELTLLRKKLVLEKKENRKLKFKLGKCCHMQFVLLLLLMYCYEQRKEFARMFEVGNIAKWLIQNHMPRDDLAKNFDKATFELSSKYEGVLRLELQLTDIASKYLEKHMTLLSQGFRKLHRQELAVVEQGSFYFNNSIYRHYNYLQFNQKSVIPFKKEPENIAVEDVPKSKAWVKPGVAQQVEQDYTLHKDDEIQAFEDVSLDDFVPDQAFNVSFQSPDSDKKKQVHKIDKISPFLQRKSDKQTPELVVQKKDKRSHSEISQLQALAFQISKEEKTLKRSKSNWKVLAQTRESELRNDGISVQKERIKIKKKAVIKQPSVALDFQLSRANKFAVRNVIQKEIEFCSSAAKGEIGPKKSQIKNQDASSALAKITKNINSQKLRMIIFKRKEQLGLDKLYNYRKRLQNDRIKNQKNYYLIREANQTKQQIEPVDEGAWREGVEDMLRRVSSHISSNISEETNQLRCEIDKLKLGMKKVPLGLAISGGQSLSSLHASFYK